jgi:hypothetical protein
LGEKGAQMPEKIEKEIISDLTSEDKKIGRKYTLDELKKSAMKVLSEYVPKT